MYKRQLEGSVHIVKEDFWGNANLMAECVPGDIFGEAYAINSTEPLEMNIFAASTCRILFLEVSKILTICPSACAFHNRLIRNLLTLVSRKMCIRDSTMTIITVILLKFLIILYLTPHISSDNVLTLFVVSVC